MTEELLTAVKEMRDLQKQYFLTRDKAILTAAKLTEKLVDRMIIQLTDKNLFNI